MSKTIYIGVDPDNHLNGLAVYDPEVKDLELRLVSFWDLIEELESYLVPIHVVIEAGWLISKSNWHQKYFDKKTNSWKDHSNLTKQKISKNVGSNHQVGILLAEYCGHKQIPFTLVKPQGKIDAKTFKAITKYEGRTNQETRDAAMLVFGRK